MLCHLSFRGFLMHVVIYITTVTHQFTYCVCRIVSSLWNVIVSSLFSVSTLNMHFLSTSVHCLIRYAPIFLVNVNRFQLAAVYVSITLLRVFLTCRLESPALNQAHPVSPGIKPNWTQSCLLDCTGWFSSVISTAPNSHSPCYRRRVFVCLCLFLCVPVPSPSVYHRPVWNWPSLASRLRFLPAIYVPQPSDSRTRPTPAHGPDLDYLRQLWFPAYKLWTVWLLCGFWNKPLVSSWTWSHDWFLFTSPDTSIFPGGISWLILRYALDLCLAGIPNLSSTSMSGLTFEH